MFKLQNNKHDVEVVSFEFTGWQLYKITTWGCQYYVHLLPTGKLKFKTKIDNNTAIWDSSYVQTKIHILSKNY